MFLLTLEVFILRLGIFLIKRGAVDQTKIMVVMQKLMVEVFLPMLPRRSNANVIRAYFGCNI